MTNNSKKTLLLVAVLGMIVVAIAFVLVQPTEQLVTKQLDSGAEQRATEGSENSSELDAELKSLTAPLKDTLDEFEISEEFDTRPAVEIYANAQEALAALRKGVEDYDDIILEQFTLPGEECAFCPALYREVTALMLKEGASEDEKAYYSEVLAISGRPENIETLTNAIREAANEDNAEIFAESLELTLGGDDVVELLSNFLEDKNELLQESSVAAITNQGSKFAAQTLYERAVQRKDPNGDYNLGIGLGEMIPDESTLPYLQELTLKKDEYSHMAVKSLLNYGHDGVVLVFDALTNSANPEQDKKILVDAIDHVGYEEATMDYLKEVLARNPSPVVAQFAQDILDGFDPEDEE